jgi:hypothetical protein
MWSATTWAGGAAFPLDTLEFERALVFLKSNISSLYVDPHRASTIGMSAPALDSIGTEKAIEMLSFFQQLTPPTYVKSDPQDPDVEHLYIDRMGGRELDLSAWFTRPCLIVIGYLDNTELPIPFRVNNDDVAPPSEGMTVVRWIYPLPVNVEVAFPKKDETETTGDGETEDGAGGAGG